MQRRGGIVLELVQSGQCSQYTATGYQSLVV